MGSLYSLSNVRFEKGKMVFAEGKKTLVPQPAKLIGHGTAVHRQVVRQLLAVKAYIEFSAAVI